MVLIFLQGKENSVGKRERHLNVKSGSPPITRCETSPSPCASNNLFSETKQQDDLNSEIVNLSADCPSAASNLLIQDQSNLEQNYHDARQFPVPLEPKSLVFYDCEEYYLDTTKNLASDLKETHSDHLVVHNFSEEIAQSFPKLESVNSLKSSINATSNLVSSVVSKNNLLEINDSVSDKVETEKSVVNTESSKTVQQNLEYPPKILQNLHSSAKIETETSEKSVESAFEKHISYNLDNKTVEVIEQKNSCKLSTDDLKDNIVENLNNENHLELPLLSNQEEESVKRVELPLNYKEDCESEDKPSPRPSGKRTKSSHSKGSRNKQQANKNKFKSEISQSNSSKAVKEHLTSGSPEKNFAPPDSNNSSCKESEGNSGSNTTEVCFTTEYSDGTNKIELAENIEEKSISGTSDQHTEIFTCNQIVECSIENKAGELENNSAIKCESLKTEIVPINNSKYSNNSEKSGEPNHIDTKENILELCENFQTQSEHTLSNKTGHFKTQSDSDQVRKCEHFQDHCEKNSKSEGEKVQIEAVICFLSSETHSLNESDNNLENQNKLSPENISYVSESSETGKSENSSNIESRPLNKGDIGIDHKVTFENNSNSSFNSNCINKLTPSDSNTCQTPQITTDRGTERDEGIYPLSISCYGNEEFEILGNEANKLAEELTDVEKPVELEYDSLNLQAMADECSKNLKSISIEGHSNAKVDRALMKRESLSLQIGDTRSRARNCKNWSEYV
ncbi:hypothetical protein Avbf_04170 [Armadillidium vulgare]|nr:hypothetical protein Avbf_04170 [Armadillidium vulgare]